MWHSQNRVSLTLDSSRRDATRGAATSRTDHELWRQDGVGSGRRCAADGTDKAGRLGQSGQYCLTNRVQRGRDSRTPCCGTIVVMVDAMRRCRRRGTERLDARCARPLECKGHGTIATVFYQRERPPPPPRPPPRLSFSCAIFTLRARPSTSFPFSDRADSAAC